MTPRTLLTAALLALSGLGLGSRVEGSIIALDEKDSAREASSVGQFESSPLPIDVAESHQLDFGNVINAYVPTGQPLSQGMGSGSSSSTCPAVQVALPLSGDFSPPNIPSGKIVVQAELKWTPPSPGQLIRPPCCFT